MKVNHINYFTKDLKVYCKLLDRVVCFDEEHTSNFCNSCDMFAGSAQGRGVECIWEDNREDIGNPHIVYNPEHEFISLHENRVLTIEKSSNHSKITGDFAEHTVLYFLSKYGYECARVDHTGIDLIAKKKNSNEQMLGISVKGKSRRPGRETSTITIDESHVTKVKQACEHFNCVPYFAFVVDAGKEINIFIVSLDKILKIFPPKSKSISWSLTPKNIQKYEQDPEIQMIRLNYQFMRL
jgi:Holliday junction resolvase-like predicted endonuclease